MNTIEEIADQLKTLKSAVIFTHMRPDGDTLGCALALSRALSMLGARTQVVNEGEIPEKFLAFAGMREICRTPSDAQAYIAVDCSEPARLGSLEPAFRAKKRTYNIDHHVSNSRYAAYNFVRPRASNAENVAELIARMGVLQDAFIAGSLMIGMVTDSGGFTHGDVNGDTLRAAALCADGGADVGRVHYELMRRQSKARAAMYAETISHIRFFNGDRLAVASVTQETLARYGLKEDATDGIVDFALSVDSVEVSVCLLEAKPRQYRASFRSKGKANVNEIARVFGGGGHVLASGCMFFGDFEEILDKIRDVVDRYTNL